MGKLRTLFWWMWTLATFSPIHSTYSGEPVTYLGGSNDHSEAIKKNHIQGLSKEHNQKIEKVLLKNQKLLNSFKDVDLKKQEDNLIADRSLLDIIQPNLKSHQKHQYVAWKIQPHYYKLYYVNQEKGDVRGIFHIGGLSTSQGKDNALIVALEDLGGFGLNNSPKKAEVRAVTWKDDIRNLVSYFSTSGPCLQDMVNKFKAGATKMGELFDPRSRAFNRMLNGATKGEDWFLGAATIEDQLKQNLVKQRGCWTLYQLKLMRKMLFNKLKTAKMIGIRRDHQAWLNQVDEEIYDRSKGQRSKCDPPNFYFDHIKGVAIGARDFGNDILKGLIRDPFINGNAFEPLTIPTRMGAGFVGGVYKTIITLPSTIKGAVTFGHTEDPNGYGKKMGKNLALTLSILVPLKKPITSIFRKGGNLSLGKVPDFLPKEGTWPARPRGTPYSGFRPGDSAHASPPFSGTPSSFSTQGFKTSGGTILLTAPQAALSFPKIAPPILKTILGKLIEIMPKLDPLEVKKPAFIPLLFLENQRPSDLIVLPISTTRIIDTDETLEELLERINQMEKLKEGAKIVYYALPDELGKLVFKRAVYFSDGIIVIPRDPSNPNPHQKPIFIDTEIPKELKEHLDRLIIYSSDDEKPKQGNDEEKQPKEDGDKKSKEEKQRKKKEKVKRINKNIGEFYDNPDLLERVPEILLDVADLLPEIRNNNIELETLSLIEDFLKLLGSTPKYFYNWNIHIDVVKEIFSQFMNLEIKIEKNTQNPDNRDSIKQLHEDLLQVFTLHILEKIKTIKIDKDLKILKNKLGSISKSSPRTRAAAQSIIDLIKSRPTTKSKVAQDPLAPYQEYFYPEAWNNLKKYKDPNIRIKLAELLKKITANPLNEGASMIRHIDHLKFNDFFQSVRKTSFLQYFRIIWLTDLHNNVRILDVFKKQSHGTKDYRQSNAKLKSVIEKLETEKED